MRQVGLFLIYTVMPAFPAALVLPKAPVPLQAAMTSVAPQIPAGPAPSL